MTEDDTEQAQEIASESLARICLSEFIGTFALVLIGCGTIMINSMNDGGSGIIGVALAHGLVLMAMIYCLGPISGGHFNPAVSLAAVIYGKINFSRFVCFSASQLLGGLYASYTLSALYGDIANLGMTTTELAPLNAVLIEAVATFLLVFVAFGTSGGVIGVAVGGILAIDILAFGAATGASMNPARSLAPAFVSGLYHDSWIYIVGPVFGAIMGGLVSKIIHGD